MSINPLEDWTWVKKNGLWTNADGRTMSPGIDPPPPNPADPLFAGHIPYRVLIGMNAAEGSPNNNAPGYTEAETLLTGAKGGFARRMFRNISGLYSNTEFDEMYNLADQHPVNRQLPVVTFKVPSNDWAGVIAGSYNTQLTTWRDHMKALRDAGKLPVLGGVHHEPSGDGSFATWGQMQLYLLRFFSGRNTSTGGSYNSANDVSSFMPWVTIMNGFKWGPRQYNAADIAAAYPQSLIDEMSEYGGPMLADFYDPEHQSYTRDGNGNRQDNLIVWKNSNPDRLSKQIQGYVDWARNNNVKAIGAGEFGMMTSGEGLAAWNIMRANRDIWCLAMHFNNFANSRWDWRLIPASYPAGNGTNSKGLVDVGGDTMSQSYINQYQQILSESVSPTYTSPL